jgi:hypothetical protein
MARGVALATPLAGQGFFEGYAVSTATSFTSPR